MKENILIFIDDIFIGTLIKYNFVKKRIVIFYDDFNNIENIKEDEITLQINKNKEKVKVKNILVNIYKKRCSISFL